MPKMLVIGDTHLKKWYPGYLEAQKKALLKIIKDSNPNIIVFLGDIFHDRHPDPYTILAFHSVLNEIRNYKSYTEIFILRGNHDTADKSDSGTSILSLFNSDDPMVSVITKASTSSYHNINFHPHYEDEDESIRSIMAASSNKNFINFGHFGFEGCIDSGPYHSFKVTLEHMKDLRHVVLGHIHRYGSYGNVTILGTPWPTNFGEGEFKHYVMELDYNPEITSWDNPRIVEVTHGPRFITCRYESLDSIKEELLNKDYFTILRVVLNKFDGVDGDTIKDKILSTTAVSHVELRFEPMLDKKLNNRLSNYTPDNPLGDISDDVILSYIDEQASSIPKEEILKGLEDIKSYENQESDS
jgi:DNA repair exonuclease SbcCD nuclease subunit